MRSMLWNQARPAAVALTAAALCLGSAARARAFSDVEVTATDGTRYDGDVVSIDVREGSSPVVQVSFGGRSGAAATWSAAFGLSAPTLLAGGGRVKLASLPPAEGVGVVALGGPDTVPAPAGSGYLSFVLDADNRRITGQATTYSGAGSATFDAGYVLTCHVRPESLGLRTDGMLDRGMTVRVPDVHFATEFCRQFAGLR